MKIHVFPKLPIEIQVIIFSFDSTWREHFAKTLHQINFIPVLQELTFFSCLNQKMWRQHIFDFQKAFRNPSWIVQMERQEKWKGFKKKFLKQTR